MIPSPSPCAAWLIAAVLLPGTAAAQDLAAHCAALAAAMPGQTRLTATVVPPSPSWSPVSQAANPVQPASPMAARPFSVTHAFCRVQGTIGADIGFELWLPDSTHWNMRMLGAGVGGDAGVFNYGDLATGVARGYAAATTDTGHKAADRGWMLGPPEKLEEFERTAEHRLAQSAVSIIRQFYGHAPAHRYFTGCSGGGRQALKEMQDYPEDYDGIIAGAPGPQTSEMTTRRMWEITEREAHAGLMSAADWQHVADAAVAQCDAADGLRDGIIADPRQCQFDVATLHCPAAEKGAFCLSPAQVSLAETIYGPLRDSAGHALDAGILPGVLVDAGRSRLAPAIFGQAVRHEANWDGRDFDVSRDYDALRRVLPDLDADNADIGAFAREVGRVILYQGMNDPAVAARMTIGYYDKVAHALGKSTGDVARLFLVPGMNHCAGGRGADRFGGSGAPSPSPDPEHDLLAALDLWVSNGQAPDRLIASKVEAGQVAETRPLCAYPKFAHYAGGNPAYASSFTCAF